MIVLAGEVRDGHADNLEFRSVDSDQSLIQRLLFSTFHGGSDPDWAPKDEADNYVAVHAYYDNFAVHNERYVRGR
ncbi:polysaccharide lyase [Phycisphaerales bacterium AB-hyl4]|uniref:Polysaccharide lyase n=1 Tax=Natronomicrosphaera hydrolytica TaxID=3242702 RepID=A0ABV4U9W7_9BACT